MRDIQLRELTELGNEIGKSKVHLSTDWKNCSVELCGYVTIVFNSPPETRIELDVYKGLEKFELVLSDLPRAYLCFKLPSSYPKSKPYIEIKSLWLTTEQKFAILSELNRICEERKNIPIMIGACYKKFKTMVESWKLTKIRTFQDMFPNNYPFVSYEEYAQVHADGNLKPEIDISTIELVECCVCFEYQSVENIQVFEPCYHYFCKSCVKSCFRSIVNSHLLVPLTCLAENCSCEASPTVIKELLGEDLYKKHDELMLEKAILMEKNSVRCLNEKCNKFACVTPNLNLIQCAYCKFELCSQCQQTYHGSSKCEFSRDKKMRMIEIWENGTENDKTKLCEKNGGLNNIKKMIESFKNEFWITTHTKPCPSCGTNIEKGVGCNMIVCGKCYTEFCWLCSQKLELFSVTHYYEGNCYDKMFFNPPDFERGDTTSGIRLPEEIDESEKLNEDSIQE